MSSYEEHVAEDRRFTILQGLEASANFAANAMLLRKYLDRVGLHVSADRLEQDLAWLKEAGLVALRKAESITIAELTVRGQDAVTGRTDIPGVRRPMPRH